MYVRTDMAKCAKCSGDDLRTKRENGGVYGMNKLPLGKGKKGTVAMDSTVCISCGNVEFTISSDDALRRIADTWERP
jgi:NAD-dependent dihydropyrimidine dehydrogenase PreA subunit